MRTARWTASWCIVWYMVSRIEAVRQLDQIFMTLIKNGFRKEGNIELKK